MQTLPVAVKGNLSWRGTKNCRKTGGDEVYAEKAGTVRNGTGGRDALAGIPVFVAAGCLVFNVQQRSSDRCHATQGEQGKDKKNGGNYP
jgi:hypothetical protein